MTSSSAQGRTSAPMTAACFAAGSRLRADGHAHARHRPEHARRQQRRQADEAHRPVRLQQRAQQAHHVGVDLTELALLGVVGQRRDRPLAARDDQRVDRVRRPARRAAVIGPPRARRLDARVARRRPCLRRSGDRRRPPARRRARRRSPRAPARSITSSASIVSATSLPSSRPQPERRTPTRFAMRVELPRRRREMPRRRRSPARARRARFK